MSFIAFRSSPELSEKLEAVFEYAYSHGDDSIMCELIEHIDLADYYPTLQDLDWNLGIHADHISLPGNAPTEAVNLLKALMQLVGYPAAYLEPLPPALLGDIIAGHPRPQRDPGRGERK